jgi:recombination protein RecR
MRYYAAPLLALLEQLEKLPGVGPKTAQRLAFHILRAPREDAQALAQAVSEVRERIRPCEKCGNFSDAPLCDICLDPRRDGRFLCVVAEARDLMAVENSGEFGGFYHVIGGLLSPLDGIGPEELRLNSLMKRLGEDGVSEVVLALSPTVEGEMTTSYLAGLLKPQGVRVTQLARGLPFGGDLDYADGATIAGALRGRREFS